MDFRQIILINSIGYCPLAREPCSDPCPHHATATKSDVAVYDRSRDASPTAFCHHFALFFSINYPSPSCHSVLQPSDPVLVDLDELARRAPHSAAHRFHNALREAAVTAVHRAVRSSTEFGQAFPEASIRVYNRAKDRVARL